MHYFTESALREAIKGVTRADADTAYDVPADLTVSYFPFPETKDSPAFPAVGAFVRVTKGSKSHVVGLCRRVDVEAGDECYFPICGPSAFVGKWDADERNRRIGEACARLPGGVSASAFRSLFEDTGDIASGDSPCAFWKGYNSRSRVLGCKHVAALAWALSQRGQIDAALELIAGAKAASVPGAPADDDETLVKLFARVCPANPGKGRKFPVLVQGAHGTGKTFGARVFGDSGGFDAVIESHGHAGIEAVDFLGAMLPVEGDRASLVWVDGPVTEAFRRAAIGQKVLLIADEIYRVPRRERSIFLSALSPAKKPDGTLVFRLKTGRPMPAKDKGLMPSMETIEAPEANLSIIATTNIGPGYDIEDDDPAEASRWHKVHYAPGESKAGAILKGECQALGFPEALAGKLLRFARNVNKLRMDGEAKLAPSTRELIRALHVAGDANAVSLILADMAHCWAGIDTDGEPNPEQTKAIRAAVVAAFK